MSTGTRLFLWIVLLGMTVLGVEALSAARAHGESFIWPLTLLALPLIGVGWLSVRIGTSFIAGWRHRGQGQKLVVGALMAVLAGGGLVAFTESTVPSQRPDGALVAALSPACQGLPVAGAGSGHIGSAVLKHMVVLDSDGNPHEWTGYPPLAWRPASLADTELVACISAQETQEQLQVCSYVNGPPITRYRGTRQVAVFDAASGRLVARYQLRDDPRSCGQTEQRDVTELRGHVTWDMAENHCGALVDPAAVVAPSDGPTPPTQPTSPIEPTSPAEPTPRPTATASTPETPDPTEPAGLVIDLVAAMEANLVAATLRGDGLQFVELELDSLSDQDLRIVVPAGTFFDARRSSTQSMVSTSEETIDLAAGQSDTWELPVACAKMRRDQPDGDDLFVIRAQPATGDLARLLRSPAFEDHGFRVQQFAVWTITNNPQRANYAALGTAWTLFGTRPTKEEFATIRVLLEQAGIDPTDYRAFR